MKRAMPWDEQIDVISSDDSSSSDSEIEANDGCDVKLPVNQRYGGKQNDESDGKQPMNNVALDRLTKEITSEGIGSLGIRALSYFY